MKRTARHTAAVFASVLMLASVYADVRPVSVERTAYLMGTRARLSIWAASRQQGLQRLEAALAALEESDQKLSTWREDSEISLMNAAAQGSVHRLPEDLCDTFRVLSKWTQETHGAFDPAVGELTAVWDLHGQGRIPAPRELAAARSRSGLALLGFDGDRCITARRAGVTVDVGAWGKGEALDRASQVLGADSWLVDLGGQISVHGAPPGDAGWRVAIANPRHRDRPFLEIRMRDGSLSTSAGSERDLTVGRKRIGHILDPATGRPAPLHGSVTVWHRRALIADVLSTALYVMGPVDGLRWAESRNISACFLVAQRNGRVEPIMTAAFETHVISSESSVGSALRRTVGPAKAGHYVR